MFFISTNLSTMVHWIMKKKFHYTEIWFQIVNFQFEVNNHRFLICYFNPCALKIEFMKKIMISSVLHLRRKFKALIVSYYSNEDLRIHSPCRFLLFWIPLCEYMSLHKWNSLAKSSLNNFPESSHCMPFTG